MSEMDRWKGAVTFSKGYKLGLRFDTRQNPGGAAYITIYGNETITHDCLTLGELDWCIARIQEDLVAIRKRAIKKWKEKGRYVVS